MEPEDLCEEMVMLECRLLVEAVLELGVQRGSWGTEWGGGRGRGSASAGEHLKRNWSSTSSSQTT